MKRCAHPYYLLLSFLLASSAINAGEIHEAVKRNEVATVRSLLEEDPSLATSTDGDGRTPLHWAARSGNLEMAALLLSKGAAIDQRTRLDGTALDLARAHRHAQLAELLIARGADQRPGAWPTIRGDYVGEQPPGSSPALFSPLILSSVLTEHGSPAFAADGSEVFWAVVFEDPAEGLLLSMRRAGDTWLEPAPLPFSEGRFRDVSPVLSADGRRLFFQSCRPVAAGRTGREYNIWCADRTESGWGEPRLLDSRLSSGKDGRPVVIKDGTLYFCSWRDGVNRIYRARSVDGRFAAAEGLASAFNEDVIPTWVSDDQTRMIFESSREGGLGQSDFWISVRGKDGAWGTPVNLGGPINSAGREGFASFSQDGKHFFFGSDRDGSSDIYWISADRAIQVDRWCHPALTRQLRYGCDSRFYCASRDS